MSDPAEPAAARLRADARACFDAALAAIEPRRLVAEFLAGCPPAATPGPAGRLLVAAAGKAAGAMASGALAVLGGRIARGVAVVPAGQEGSVPPPFRTIGGGHPVPTAGSVEGARAILELAREAGPSDLLLCLVSGGGSALLALPPPELCLTAVQATTAALLAGGATIGQLNTVRKHLDLLKGGRLARAAAPARVLALVLSDVVGDPLDVIASGPLSPDPTLYGDAIAVMRRLGAWATAPLAVRRHLERGAAGEEPESPKPGDPCFATVETRVVGNNAIAVEAARQAAAARGYRTLLLTTRLVGEAREAGAFLAAVGLEARASGRPLPPPACLLAAGETTVRVVGHGSGGRNQEVALGGALALEGSEGILLASLGTDGIDGPTDAAGAWTDGHTAARARAAGLDPAAALAANDAYPLFDALGDLVRTGPTGTNVMDLQLVLVGAGG